MRNLIEFGCGVWGGGGVERDGTDGEFVAVEGDFMSAWLRIKESNKTSSQRTTHESLQDFSLRVWLCIDTAG